MEQQTVPMSYDDGKSAAYNNSLGSPTKNVNETKATYDSYMRSPTPSGYPVDPNELESALKVIEKVRLSLMQQSERMGPQSPLKSQTPYTVRTVSGLPESINNPYTYSEARARPSLAPISGRQPSFPPFAPTSGRLPSFINEREVRFSKTQSLPPRDPSRQSIWRRSLQTMSPTNRRASGMLFGPGGPATPMDPEFPSGDNNADMKVLDPGAVHEYLYNLSKALMLYGAPGHRLERYLSMTAVALRTKVDFTYHPDHMTMYIDDQKNHTGYSRLIKGAGTDLGRWLDTHNVSKHVVHGRMTIEDGTYQLKQIASREPKHSEWFLFFIYGLAGIGIAPFAYGARFVDLPLCFMLSVMLGVMQIKFAPRNHLTSVLFEVSAAIIFSFLGRMLGSIKNMEGDRVFCYGAVSEAAINLIQPGYWITNAVLELMNHQIAASGARLMYALVYAIMLAYGVAVGSSLYGLIDHDAVSSTVCEDQISPFWNLFFVPFFSAQVGILGGAKFSQLPAMVFICFSMYSAFFFSSRAARGSFTVGATAGGIIMGLLGNGYARMGRRIEIFFQDLFTKRSTHAGAPHGDDIDASNPEYAAHDSTLKSVRSALQSHIGYTCAAATMVPSMIVLVPSGLANRGSHLAGILAAESIVNNTTGTPAFPAINSEVFTAALPIYLNVLQVSISIAVGLSIGAIAIYPFGKIRSGVMSW